MKKMPDLKAAYEGLYHKVTQGLREGEGSIPECYVVNRWSRAIVRAMRREKGVAWIGNINIYEETRGKPVIQEYRKGMVFNFEVAFVLPVFDQILQDMILARDMSKYTTSSADYKRIIEIFKRIEEVGGLSLIWS